MSSRSHGLSLVPGYIADPAGDERVQPVVLLQTKLTRPRALDARQLLPRARLLERLHDGDARRLTLICAPAGYGKTTLLLQLLAERQGHSPVAWFAVDEQDNDPARFVAYLYAATMGALAQGAAPPSGVDASGSSAGALLDHAINELTQIDRPVTLVIDDLHRINSPVAHAYLAHLLDLMPSTLRVIISTRAEPPLPLARYRAYGDLLEIRADDLSFTAEETEHYLTIAGETALRDALVRGVYERTGGWIFALNSLKTLLVSEPPARHEEIVRGFIGSHRRVADFLLEEMLRRQTLDRRDFLLRTSVLPRMTGRLCDALTGRDDGAETLVALEREGLPVFALDDQRRWYRYHHLLSELLLEQLRNELSDDGIAALHRTACAYFAAENSPEEAIEHALAARDWDRAVALVHDVGYDPVGQRRVATFRRWLETLPADRLNDDPVLSYWYGRSLYTMDEPRRARVPLERAERRWAAIGEPERIGDVRESRAWCAILDGSHTEAVELAEQALELNRGRNRRAAAGSRYTYAAALSRLGRANDALAQLELIGADTELATLASIELGHILMLLGRYDDARASLRAGLAADNPIKLLLRGHVWLAGLEQARDELESAREQLERAESLVRQLSARPFHPSLEAAKAKWLWVSGEREAALRVIEHGIEQARAAAFVPAVRFGEAVRAGFHLELGRLDDVRRWRASIDREDRQNLGEGIDAEIVEARLLARDGQVDEAATLLEETIALAADHGRVIDAGRARVQLAVIRTNAGDAARGRVDLDDALTMVHPSGNVRVFIDDEAAPGVLGPLREIAATGRHVDVIGRILEVVRETEGAARRTPAGPIDSLSPREREVLRLVAIGLSNRDIADQLFISVPTVKRHLSTVFEKLEVANRTQAVAIARAHGVL